jgi:activator of 2-hydroxyglutaryl-CoA dehydratase
VTGNAGLAKALEERLNVKVITLRVASLVATDIGAALIATEKS